MSDRVNGGRYPGCEYEYAKIPGVSGIFAPKKEQGEGLNMIFLAISRDTGGIFLQVVQLMAIERF